MGGAGWGEGVWWGGIDGGMAYIVGWWRRSERVSHTCKHHRCKHHPPQTKHLTPHLQAPPQVPRLLVSDPRKVGEKRPRHRVMTESQNSVHGQVNRIELNVSQVVEHVGVEGEARLFGSGHLASGHQAGLGWARGWAGPQNGGADGEAVVQGGKGSVRAGNLLPGVRCGKDLARAHRQRCVGAGGLQPRAARGRALSWCGDPGRERVRGPCFVEKEEKVMVFRVRERSSGTGVALHVPNQHRGTYVGPWSVQVHRSS